MKTRFRVPLAQYRCVQEPVRESLLRPSGRGRIKIAERLCYGEFSHSLQEIRTNIVALIRLGIFGAEVWCAAVDQFGSLEGCSEGPLRVESGCSGQATRLPLLWVGLGGRPLRSPVGAIHEKRHSLPNCLPLMIPAFVRLWVI